MSEDPAQPKKPVSIAVEPYTIDRYGCIWIIDSSGDIWFRETASSSHHKWTLWLQFTEPEEE